MHTEKSQLNQDEDYRSLVADIPALVCCFTPDGTVTYVNKAYCLCFNKEPGDMIGRSFLDLVPEKDHPWVMGNIRSLSRDNPCQTHEHQVVGPDGALRWHRWTNRAVFDEQGHVEGYRSVGEDVTWRKVHEQEQDFLLKLLSSMHKPNDLKDLIRELTALMQSWSGCEAVAIRLKDGHDFPYYETRGLPQAFVRAENSLCIHDPNGEVALDSTGNPVLECMCGNVICGRFDPSLPFFTPLGSFWTNCTTDLLATTSEKDRQARTRNRCNGEGYESVALIPLKSGDQVFGLLQFNDHHKNKFQKDTIQLLERLASHLALGLSQRITAEALRESEMRFRMLFTEMINGFALHEMIYDDKGAPADYRFLAVNPAFEHQTGLKAIDIEGKTVRDILPGTEDYWIETYGKVAMTGEPIQFENYARELGRYFHVTAFRPAVDRFACIFADITAMKSLEARLQQAQKMESIGNLAGGIAHDFNNILFPIVGMSDMLIDELPLGSQERQCIVEINKAGKRGSDLVKQILSFSRKYDHKKIPVHIQQVLKEVLGLVRSTIPADIDIHQDIQADCGLVMAAPTQIHQIAMNLITNAYHAVEKTGGSISVSLDQVDGPPTSDLPQGPCVRLIVSDTGHGIDPSQIEKIFEPYFTTKEQGKGTGLGLSVVYGLVKDHAGDIRVDSEPDKGTVFTVHFPKMKTSKESLPKTSAKDIPTGHEHVLLVDDEAAVVRIETRILEKLGYRVTSFSSSREALEVFNVRSADFDLVITDMTMPGITGAVLAKELMHIRPDMPIILCTGFSERMDRQKAEAIGIKGFLMKPVEKAQLASLIRDVLDRTE